MRRLIQLLFLVLAFQAGYAQKTDLWAKQSDNGLYLEHKVVPKESYFSIGRKYNVNPKSLAAFNKLDINKGLQIDQKLRIPLTDTNFVQKGYTGTPVYYKSGSSESLSDISNKHKTVSTARLREWNDLEEDDKASGKKLIIGFLQSREMESVTIKPKKKFKEEKNSDVATTDNKEKKGDKDKENDNKVKEEKSTDVAVTENKGKVGEKESENGPKTEEKKTEPVVSRIEVKPTVTGQGYFQKHFEQQTKTSPANKNETVTAGIFKTLSGWDDAKYYLLIDAVQPGTIIKVVNPGNNKAVYAKVLGQMSGIRQNEGLSIRISNAAAAALEISEQDKFIVNVNY